jgi:hypothetical protein
MAFLNALTILALLAFIAYVIWRNRRYESRLNLQPEDSSDGVDSGTSQTQIYLSGTTHYYPSKDRSEISREAGERRTAGQSRYSFT